MIDKVKQGKKNKASGASFERKVRSDLESKGWIVSKWMNNISEGKLIPAKHKFCGLGRPMAIGTGFPDFIALRNQVALDLYEIIGVEAKSNGYLDKTEKEKCKWLIDNNIFSKILISSKTKVKNKIVVEYKEFA